ncbi:MAG TPA: EamA family transporter [Patescibacteria group bacterium]|nr:EamA family transporter [Patescibacteria group bacterium]
MKKEIRRPLLALLMATQVMAWSFNYIAGKVALRQLDPLTLASFRLVLAGAIYLPIFLLAPRPMRLGWRDPPTFLLLGVCGVVINQGCFTVSLHYTSIGHVALIIAMGPIFVLLLARLMGQETLSPGKIIGMLLSFSGVALLAIGQGSDWRSGGLAGDLIALCAACGFACYAVLSKRVAHRYDSIAFNTFTHLTGALLLLPLAVHQALGLDWAHVSWPSWAGLSYMALFGSVAGYFIFYKLLGHISATQVASLNYLLPVVATSLGVVLLGERVGRIFLLAAALVLTGLWLAQGTSWQDAPAD